MGKHMQLETIKLNRFESQGPELRWDTLGCGHGLLVLWQNWVIYHNISYIVLHRVHK